MSDRRWKLDTNSHRLALEEERDGAEPYGNPCERRGCLEMAVVILRHREVCETHADEIRAAVQP
jgi:hypothetical protein